MAESQQASSSPPPRSSRRQRRQGQPAPVLPDDVIVEQILTRVPAAAAVRFRAVCRAWRAALTSDQFVQAHHRTFIRAGDAHPEIVFFAPKLDSRGSTSTAFYTCKLELTPQQIGSSSPSAPAPAPASARELVTVDNARPNDDLVPSSTRPCLGLTLLFEPKPNADAYHVCHLPTGEHVSLPPCTAARRWIPYLDAPHCYRLSSTGLGFDPVAGEHMVVRLYEDWLQQQRCEVYGLRSGGWRPFAGPVPPHAAKGLDARHPPVFLNGCFYWHIDIASRNDGHEGAVYFSTPEPILSLAVDTKQFGWVHPPEDRMHKACFHLTELDGSLCVVVDLRQIGGHYELWTWPVGSGSPATWSLRCRISLASLPGEMREDLGRGVLMVPLTSFYGGEKILFATSRHEVHAYDPERNSSDMVFSVYDFIDATDLGDAAPLLSIFMHEESVTGAWHRHVAGDGAGQLLKMKIGGHTVARREGQRRKPFAITPQFVQFVIGPAMAQFQNIINMFN